MDPTRFIVSRPLSPSHQMRAVQHAQNSLMGEPDGADDFADLMKVFMGCTREVEGINDEPLTGDVEDPQPVDLAGCLLVAVRAADVALPRFEVALVTIIEVDVVGNTPTACRAHRSHPR